jgi:hypothetical protein
MTRLIIPVERSNAVVNLAQLLHKFLDSEKYTMTRGIFGLWRDVPYVAQTLTDSVLPVHPKGFWQLRSLSEAKEFFLDFPNMPATVWEAKHQADQLLLLLGAGQSAKMRWDAISQYEVTALIKIGSRFYEKAADQFSGALKEDLCSMATDFRPWIEILPEFHKSRSSITV